VLDLPMLLGAFQPPGPTTGYGREKRTSGPEGRLVLTIVVRAKARTYLLADIAFELFGFSAMLTKVAAPAWAMERILPGKMPRMKVARL
jgi:hypothetical protein